MKSSLVFLVCLVTTAAAQIIQNRTACDNTSTLGATEGNIHSPNYPGLYENGLFCSYYINSSQEVTLEFVFESFNTESCCDYVTISCLSDPSFPPQQLSGYFAPGSKVWVSGCNQGFVNFRTDNVVVNTGFNLTYYVFLEDTTTCGDTSYNGPSGVISSPNYPGNYNDNLDCDYYIYVSAGSSLSLIFKSFDVEDGYDYVTISCADNTTFLPQIYTGNSIPDAVSIPWCSRGKVTFHTDYTTAFSGFSLNYYISVGGCGNTVYTGSNGYVTTSNYPDEHGPNQNCSYIIWAPERSTFYLNSEFFYLDSCCDCNWLEIRCIDNSDYGPYRFCTIYTTAVNLYIYGCSQVLLWFHSNAVVYQEGFKIQYTVYPEAETTTVAGTPDFTQTTYTPPVSTLEPVCIDETRYGPSGVITSPNYPGNYYNGLSCFYYIYATIGGSTALIFNDFHLDDQDSLEISCTTNSDFPKQNHSGQTLPPPLLMQWCLEGRLHFSTDSSTVFSGFSIDYYVSDGDCGNTVHNESIGNVTSPNYPSNYNYNQNCSNIIWAPQRSHFHLNFLFFELQDCGLCPRDWVEISCLDNNPSDKHRFCGTSHYPVDFYQCSQVLVLFHSDGWNNYQGFNLEYNVSPDSETTTVAGTTVLPLTTLQTSPVSTLAPGCDALHCGTSGTITSPNYPGLYHNSLKCNNDIYAATESSITFIFEHFDMQDDTDYITIRCETNASFPEQRYSGHTLPPPLSIPWCSQASLYFQTDTDTVFSGFSIDYYVSDGGCGNTVYTGSAGNVTSPNYPREYPSFQNCSNIIWAPQPSHFNLRFEYINVGTICYNCICDWVEFTCLDNNPSHRRKFCGANEEILDFYQCTQVLVWFHSDGYPQGPSGFDLDYNVYPMPGCGDESYYGPSGVISSANYPEDYNDNLFCDYIIDTFSSSGSIAIIFKAFNTEECCDYVTVSCATNSSYSPVTYSGSSLPQPMSIPWCSQGRVNLRTDISIVSPGFSLDYHVSLGGCGDTVYTGVNGIVSSPNYPNNYSDSQNCSNIIWTNKLTTFYISFLYMDLEECCDFVELSCLDNPAYGNHRFTGDTLPPTETISQCTQVLVWFFSDDSKVYKGFSLEYLTTSEPDDPNVLDNKKLNAAENVPSNGKPNAAEKVPSNGKPNAAEKIPSNGKSKAVDK